MGTHAVRFIDDAAAQKKAFDHVRDDIRCLEEMIEAGRLRPDATRIGAEQEVCLIDPAYRPAPVIAEFLDGIDDDHFTTELGRFNLEINLDPLVLKGDCFARLESDLRRYLRVAQERGRELGEIDLILVGILPTIHTMDLELDNLTPDERARSMIAAMKRLKQEDYSIRINGIDELTTTDFSNMFEAANTSFQIHYQIDPDDFVDRYNYAQAIAAPVLAASTNSPILFGKRLWHETRIALFQQAVDTRESTTHLSEAYLRVPFGRAWVEGSVIEMFEDDLATFTIFLESTKSEDTLETWKRGELPELVHLSVFNSSVFRWTRACFGTTEGRPHLRIENRLLPSGPTVQDEVANAAFWTGLMHGMPERYRGIAERMNFEDAKINILKAARYGLGTQFRWLNQEKIKAEELLVDELLPIARAGLERAEVEEDDVDRFLGIVRDRVTKGRTGSQWMFDAWMAFEDQSSPDARCAAITAAMARNQRDGSPVHEWELPGPEALPYEDFSRVAQFMSTDIFCVREGDLLEQTLFSMLKKGYEHVPVTDADGTVQGLINKTAILEKIVTDDVSLAEDALTVKDVMLTDPVSIHPSASLQRAIELMKERDCKYLLVEYKDKLTGIITEHDMMRLAAFLLRTQMEDQSS